MYLTLTLIPGGTHLLLNYASMEGAKAASYGSKGVTRCFDANDPVKFRRELIRFFRENGEPIAEAEQLHQSIYSLARDIERQGYKLVPPDRFDVSCN